VCAEVVAAAALLSQTLLLSQPQKRFHTTSELIQSGLSNWPKGQMKKKDPGGRKGGATGKGALPHNLIQSGLSIPGHEARKMNWER